MGLDTLANVKSRLGITADDQDAFLQQQIDLISDVIEAYCRRKFITDEYIQTFYREENPYKQVVELFHYPLQSVDSISQDGVPLDSSTYRFNKPLARVISKGMYFFTAEETVFQYTAGYDTCPSPVLSVLDTLVSERYNKKISGVDLNFGSDVQRISIAGAMSLDFDYSLSNNERKSAYGTILGSQANILDDWRSERAVIGSGKMEYVEEAP